MDNNFFQNCISSWARTNFGLIASLEDERVSRFLEESLELCQSLNFPKEKILEFVEIVYNKPVGNFETELADVQLNLYALADNKTVSLSELSQDRFLGCLAQDRDYLRQRQERKYETGLSKRLES